MRGLAEEVEEWGEAKGRGYENGVHYVSRRSATEGLDRSGTLGIEKRQVVMGWAGIGVYRACRFGMESIHGRVKTNFMYGG